MKARDIISEAMPHERQQWMNNNPARKTAIADSDIEAILAAVDKWYWEKPGFSTNPGDRHILIEKTTREYLDFKQLHHNSIDQYVTNLEAMTKQYTAVTGAAVSAPDKASKFIT